MNYNNLILKISEEYKISVNKIRKLTGGYRNMNFLLETDTGKYVLTVYKAEPGILAKIKTANYLGKLLQNKLPVRTAISEKIIIVTDNSRRNYAAIYNYLPGQTHQWSNFSQKQLKILGNTLASMHYEFQLESKSEQELPNFITEFSSVINLQFERMLSYLEREDIIRALSTKLSLRANIRELHELKLSIMKIILSDQKQNSSLLHLDFVRGNILFTENTSRITGILDFEKGAHGPIIADISRTLAFLLVDIETKSAQKIQKYFIRSGYQRFLESAGAGELNIKNLNYYLSCFWAFDFYKFLLHNPYEFLPQNYHFRRTLAWLLQTKLVEIC